VIDWFYSDNATTISEASCRTFQYEKFLVKIWLQWKRTWATCHDPEEGLNFLNFVMT